MSFADVSGSAIGIGALSQAAFSAPARWRAFVSGDNQDLVKIEVSAPSGSILGVLPLDVQDSVVQSFKFKTGDFGGTEFELVLNSDPGFPLVRFTEITVWIGDKRAFRGYIWKRPGPEKRPTDPFRYSGFGMSKRLEKAKIALKTGVNIYQIDSITMAGVDMTVQSISNLATTDVVGCVAIIKGAEDSNSNCRAEITAATADSITVVNPAGVNQTLDIGQLYILPREWSEPTTTISELIKQVVRDYLTDLPISQTLDFIEDTPDAITNCVVDLDGMTFSDFFEKMRTILPDYLLFVDEQSRVVLRQKEGLIDTLLTGYDIEETDETIDEDSIVNRITVNRKIGKEQQKVGFITQAGFAEDASSIANEGEFSDEVDVPVFWGDELCQTYAEEDLARRKLPRTTLKVSNMPFRRYRLGDYRIISAPKIGETTVSQCENAAEWTYDPEKFLALEVDSNVKQFGTGSIRMDYDSGAIGKTAVIDCDVLMTEAVRLRFWFKGSQYGQRVTVGIGENSITEHEFTVFVYSGKWKPFDIDPSGLGMSRLKRFGFRIDEASSRGQGTYGFPFGDVYSSPHSIPDVRYSFWVDQISVVANLPQDRTLELVEIDYNSAAARTCDLIFGSRKEKFDTFIAGQYRALQSARLALREN